MSSGSESRVQEALGESEAFLLFQERLSQVARVDRPVLLLGERGTGKELAAQRLHFLSKRWEEPFITLNCAALSPTLIEAELFGHEAGAFTGATRQRQGRFEAADQGTLFLDEVGSIPLQAQEKILRAVEYNTFERVGSSERVHVDVRIVGATNADLRALAAAGEFQEDLLDRLSFEVLVLPPLRERRQDILLLANHFAARMAFELGQEGIPEFTPAVEEALLQYPWPGNVRELKNVVERAIYRATGTTISTVVFNPFPDKSTAISATPRSATQSASAETRHVPASAAAASPLVLDSFARPFPQAVQAFEVALLTQALARSQYNQRRAAERLGLTYNQFRGLYRKYKNQLAG